MTAIYRGMDRAALDAAYDNAAVVADSQTYRAKWWDRSAEPASRLGLRYSERPRATLDYFPAQADAPSAPTNSPSCGGNRKSMSRPCGRVTSPPP
jgi:hypothetical protein